MKTIKKIGIESADYNYRTYEIASAIVRLAIDGHMPAGKVLADVSADVSKVLENLSWKPPVINNE